MRRPFARRVLQTPGVAARGATLENGDQDNGAFARGPGFVRAAAGGRPRGLPAIRRLTGVNLVSIVDGVGYPESVLKRVRYPAGPSAGSLSIRCTGVPGMMVEIACL